MHPAVQQTVQHMLSLTGMLALQQQAMEKRLGRPMREDEARKMKAEARASAMASLSFLVARVPAPRRLRGSSCGASTASRARVSRSRCSAGRRAAEGAQGEAEATVGPVISSIKVTSEVAIWSMRVARTSPQAAHEPSDAVRATAPTGGRAEGAGGREGKVEAREERERAEAHAAIVAAEAAWQASGGAAAAGGYGTAAEAVDVGARGETVCR